MSIQKSVPIPRDGPCEEFVVGHGDCHGRGMILCKRLSNRAHGGIAAISNTRDQGRGRYSIDRQTLGTGNMETRRDAEGSVAKEEKTMIDCQICESARDVYKVLESTRVLAKRKERVSSIEY